MAETAQPESTSQEAASLPTAKLAALEARLRSLDSLMVAYSGGVDSAFLAATAHRVLGDRMLAVLADSPSLARRELSEASEFASSIGMPLHIVETDELDKPDTRATTPTAASTAKTSSFKMMETLGAKLG